MIKAVIIYNKIEKWWELHSDVVVLTEATCKKELMIMMDRLKLDWCIVECIF